MTQTIKKQLLLLAGLTACSLIVSSCNHSGPHKVEATKVQTQTNNHNPSLWPQPVSKVAKDPAMEKKIDALIAKMTLEQKVGQTMQPEIRNVTVADIKKYHIGSILNGGGSFPNANKLSKPSDWVKLADSYYQASMEPAENGIAIPIMWGTDAVHGHNNVVGATLYPHNIALGAMNNPELIKKIGAATAAEIAATGIGWSFAPTLAVVRDDHWGRTYESYSEHPDIVKAYAGKMVEGLQGTPNTAEFLSDAHVLATAKHFLGDGGTTNGIDRGNTQVSEEELVRIHAQGYVTAIESGVQTIMASFNSWNGEKMHGNPYLLTDILKNRMGFDGLIVGDWNGHEFIPGCKPGNCPQALNAGLDIYMAPDAWKELFENTVAQVKSGVIPQARLDDAVRRILRVKMRAGMFEAGAPSAHRLAGDLKTIGAPEHRAIARQAVRESLVLLKNKNQLLPIKAKSTILVAGDGADNIGKQAGGWSISWQGTGNANSDFPGATSIYQGIADAAKANGGKAVLSANGEFKNKPDVAVVVFGENPYAEMQGDISKLEFASEKELKLVQKLKAQGIPVVSLFITGRPLWVNPFLNASDAFAVIWHPGTEGAGVADVLVADEKNKARFDFKGKLSFSWPNTPEQSPLNVGQENYSPLFAYGYGMTYADKNTLGDNLDESALAAKKNNPTLEIFKSRSIDPWQLVLMDEKHVPKLVQTSVASHGALSYRTVDRLVQEDTLQLTWSGAAIGRAGFMTKDAVDYSSIPSNAALVFDVKVDKKPTADVSVGMYCGENCGEEKSIADLLKGLTPNTWSTFSVSLTCFDKVKLNALLSPFYLVTSGELSVSLYHVRIESTEKPVVSCQ